MQRPWESYLRRVTPYVPGEQPKLSQMIKLNTNENPYPPAPGVAEALRELPADDLRRYPDPAIGELVEGLAAFHGVKPEQIFVGVGSDDVLAMAFLTFFGSDLPILFPDITYSFYEVWAELFQIPAVRVPLASDFSIRPADYRRENGGVVLANPNAPTSLCAPLAAVEDIVSHNQKSVVIVDEAYVDFGGVSALPLLSRYENLLITRTFSKSRSLAGLRIGYAIGSPALICAMQQVKYSYNSYTLSTPTIKAGAASLRDQAYFTTCCEKVMRTREKSEEELKALGFSMPQSATNFLFVTHEKAKAQDLQDGLRRERIFVRHFSAPRIDNYLRITVGTEEEMAELMRALKGLLG